MAQQAFVLRIAPSGIDRVQEALESDQIIIGWSEVPALLNPDLDWQSFREIVRAHYCPDDKNLRRAGRAAGEMWRFIRAMQPSDLVVTPHGPEFFVARVIGEATHDQSKVEDDTAFRRQVEWLNNKRPIPRSLARTALQSRMKSQGTSVGATDLLDEIQDCLRLAATGEQPTFGTDLHKRLVREALEEIRSGRIDNYGFERLVAAVLQKLGGRDVQIVGRRQDKGADILATFLVAGAFQMVVAVQAKHYQAEPPVGTNVVDEIIRGIEAESASLGMIVTAGTISDEAAGAAERYFEDTGVKIELVDGPQLASLIVEGGLSGDSLLL